MQKIIKIGTRDSKLAVWQAEFVKQKLDEKGFKSELVFIKSDGDKNTTSPLYEMGVEGIFTKALDIALLDNQIDIAVHSLKDVPTRLPEGLIISAIPERGKYEDILIYKDNLPDKDSVYTIGSSSLRRKAQWLNMFPNHQIEPLRGNIQKRLEKLDENTHWNGAIFAKTAIERLGIDVKKQLNLDFMLPAPAQGALGIVCRENDRDIIDICNSLNHKETEIAVTIERQFLRLLFGGCSMPIGALALVGEKTIRFKGNLLSLDGSEKYEVEFEVDRSKYNEIVQIAVDKILENGEAVKLLDSFKKLKLK